MKATLLRGIRINPLDEKKKWPQPFLKLVHPLAEKESPGARKAQSLRNNNLFEKEFGKYLPKGGPNAIYRDMSFMNPFF